MVSATRINVRSFKIVEPPLSMRIAPSMAGVFRRLSPQAGRPQGGVEDDEGAYYCPVMELRPNGTCDATQKQVLGEMSLELALRPNDQPLLVHVESWTVTKYARALVDVPRDRIWRFLGGFVQAAESFCHLFPLLPLTKHPLDGQTSRVIEAQTLFNKNITKELMAGWGDDGTEEEALHMLCTRFHVQ